MSKKYYVLDTNVYLSDCDAIFAYKNNDVGIPLKVLEEVDKHKKRQDGVGVNARQFIRTLDGLREKGSLQDEIKLGKGKGSVSVLPCDLSLLPDSFEKSVPDNQIIASTLTLIRKLGDNKNVVLVSQDINMRVKCDSLGILTEDYVPNQVVERAEEVFIGYKQHVVDDAVIDRFHKNDKIYLLEKEINLFANEYVMLVSNTNEKKSALARFKSYSQSLVKVKEFKGGIFGVHAKNKEQQFALDSLMDPEVKIVSLIGKAGSGKTLIALAAGLQQILEDKIYTKLIVSRPVQPMGKDIGFLPGPQPLDAKLATPTGWVEMGSIKVGDNVIGRDGSPTRVLGVFPKGKKLIYKVTTTDDSSTECCEDHLWLTRTFEEKKRNKHGQVRTTKQIIDTFKTTNGKLNHFLPRVSPVQYTDKELPLPAYTLGVLLGDGCIKNNISVCNTDHELIKRVENEIKSLGCRLTNDGKTITYNIRTDLYNNKPARQVTITNVKTLEKTTFPSIGKSLEVLNINRSTLQSRCDNNTIIDGIKYEFTERSNRWQNPIKNILDNLHLSNKKAWEKFIPEIYKFSCVQDRINLLKGLMDTDGTVKTNGESSFTTTSLQLAKDMQELVRSLGGRAVIKERNRVGKKSYIDGREINSRRISYEFTVSLPQNINPFYISRKASRHSTKYIQGVGIKSIELVGKKEAQCILVENKEHLYVTNDFIVTHNTLEEKMTPWLAPVQDNLEFLLGSNKEHMRMMMEAGTIEMEALTYIRGRSISNAYIIIDESQNLTSHELKTIITRVGEGTKIVLTGDIYQIDNQYVDATTNGLTYVIEKMKPYELVGHVALKRGERSSVATLAADIL
jgi:predicted ribonuclease YlaK